METTYKKTVAGSVGAGIGAIFNSTSKNYYILEHKTDTLYHKVGESQKIIVDEIELGRDVNCQVRFDEACETVSRHHAAIVKDGQGWKIISLSKTNVTLVNGQPVNGEWHLNSGDEIQLSSKGPVMGFIAPQGTANSIGLSERFRLFNEQALRPYRVALIIIAVLLIAAIGLGVYAIVNSNNITIVENQAAPEKPITPVEVYENSIYYIKMDNISLYKPAPSNELVVSFTTDKFIGGTGFLLNNGRFVTARRVVEPWYYKSEESYECIGKHGGYSWSFRDLQFFSSCGYKIVANFTAYSRSGNNFQFKNTDMEMSEIDKDNSDYIISEEYRPEMGKKYALKTKSGLVYYFDSMLRADYAVMAKQDQLTLNGGVPSSSELSGKLPASKEVNIIGFPEKMGFVSSTNINPMKSVNNINVTGFNAKGVIELSSKKYKKGNDGAPVFAIDDSNPDDRKWVVVGILSHSDEFDRDIVVPISYFSTK